MLKTNNKTNNVWKNNFEKIKLELISSIRNKCLMGSLANEPILEIFKYTQKLEPQAYIWQTSKSSNIIW